jgi:hypothetical protein
MFDAGLCATSDLMQMSVLSHQLIALRLEELCSLGHERDIEFLFFANDPCRPDWQYAAEFNEKVRLIIKEIFTNAHDAARADDELALRAKPN